MLSATAGPVAVKHVYQGTKQTRPNQLSIRLKIANGTEEKKIRYLSWQHGRFDRKSFRDDLGNTYSALKLDGFTKIDGVAGVKNLYPGDSCEDLLVIEAPVAKASHVYLVLPGENAELDADVTLTIPASMYP